jgi:hypothetical protein
MQKRSRIFIIICLLIFLSGCGGSYTGTSEKIVLPKNNEVPIKGKWQVVNCLNKASGLQSPNQGSEWTGKIAQFSTNAAVVGDYYWPSPNYKIKKVNAEEYFINNLRSISGKFNITTEDVSVITVTSSESFICEFIESDSKNSIAVVDENILILKKISDEVDLNFEKEIGIKYKKVEENNVDENKEISSDSGILLGIRTPKKVQSPYDTKEFSYRTLWISAKDKSLQPIIETDDLLLPRKTGFWKVGVNREIDKGVINDVIFAHTLLQQSSSNVSTSIGSIDNNKSVYNSILYVGNDFISTEAFNSVNNNLTVRLKMEPVDNILSDKGVQISDFAGQSGNDALKKAKKEFVMSLNKPNIVETDRYIEEENFGLVRKTGHWFFKGRISFIGNNKTEYSDFNINLIPSSNLIHYDTLYLPWTLIKDKVPEANDAFTSPNKDLALIISGSKLLIYSINNGSLSDEPLKRIKLQEGDSVVMAEWATGDYVDKWSKVFYMNKVREVN